jgi:hypothetical protein
VLGYVWVRIRVRASDVIAQVSFRVMASTTVKVMVLLMV